MYNSYAYAGVVELADARDSKSRVRFGRTGSTPVTGTTSEQALYRLLRLFYKSQSALMPLLLLSKSKPLCWASIWFWAQAWKQRHLYGCDVTRRCGRHTVHDDVFFFRTNVISHSFCRFSFSTAIRFAGFAVGFGCRHGSNGIYRAAMLQASRMRQRSGCLNHYYMANYEGTRYEEDLCISIFSIMMLSFLASGNTKGNWK